jgi:pimeloyl-ACP methyl ester carboxylesterase
LTTAGQPTFRWHSDALVGWAAEIAGQIDGARSVVVDDAGHCPQIEQSSVVNELLLDFYAAAREAQNT